MSKVATIRWQPINTLHFICVVIVEMFVGFHSVFVFVLFLLFILVGRGGGGVSICKPQWIRKSEVPQSKTIYIYGKY